MSRLPTEQFITPPPEAYLCCICRDVLDEPTETPCRHLFCWECIVPVMDRNSKCPMCRNNIASVNELKPVLPAFKSLLDQLQMKCSYDQCQKVVPCEKYLHHLENCDFVMVTCPFDNCNHKCYKKDVSDHKTKCAHRRVDCPRGCGLKIVYKYTERHIDCECVNGNMQCPQCKKPKYLQDDNHSCFEHLLSLIDGLQQTNQRLENEGKRLRQENVIIITNIKDINQRHEKELQRLQSDNAAYFTALADSHQQLEKEMQRLRQENVQLKTDMATLRSKVNQAANACQELQDNKSRSKSMTNGTSQLKQIPQKPHIKSPPNADQAIHFTTQQLSDMLAATPPKQQKHLIRESLYPIIQSIKPGLAGPITDMLLQQQEMSQLLLLMESEELLKHSVEIAASMLNSPEIQR